MHISALAHAYLPTHMAGAETTLHDALRALVSVGWTAEVSLTRPETEPLGSEPYELDGVLVRPWTGNMDAIDAVDRADLVITHLESTERAVILSQMYKKPVAQLVHNTMWQTEGYLRMGCDLAIYNTEWVANHHLSAQDPGFAAVQTLGRTRFVQSKPLTGPYTVLHPLVDADLYRVDGPHDCITLVNLWENKGPAIFYEMASRFPEQKFLGVVGGYGQQDIRDLPNVEIVEHTSDIARDVYSRTKIILMPSTYESYGRVAVEAAASGIPTIANPTPGLQEALGEAGYYADISDLTAWTEALAALLNPAEYRGGSRAALARSDHWMSVRKEEVLDFIQLAEHVTIERMKANGTYKSRNAR